MEGKAEPSGGMETDKGKGELIFMAGQWVAQMLGHFIPKLLSRIFNSISSYMPFDTAFCFKRFKTFSEIEEFPDMTWYKNLYVIPQLLQKSPKVSLRSFFVSEIRAFIHLVSLGSTFSDKILATILLLF